MFLKHKAASLMFPDVNLFITHNYPWQQITFLGVWCLLVVLVLPPHLCFNHINPLVVSGTLHSLSDMFLKFALEILASFSYQQHFVRLTSNVICFLLAWSLICLVVSHWLSQHLVSLFTLITVYCFVCFLSQWTMNSLISGLANNPYFHLLHFEMYLDLQRS